MDVIGAGFGRTGTLSLKVALEQLGFGPCLHMLPMMQDPERAALLRKAAEGDAHSLDAAIEGFRATVDWPGTYFWRELAAKFPAGKVVLSVRDPQKWYESMENTIVRSMRGAFSNADPDVLAMVQATVWEGTFGGGLGDREAAIKIFEEHNDAVRREIAPDRLLVFEVTQGWGPLCEFLDVPVPDGEFPRLNDTAAFNERLATRCQA